jgi:hypothetical protein
MADQGSETKRLQAPKDGAVLVTVETTVTEREIAEERETIVLRLHGSYLNLVDEMAGFQKAWDENPRQAFLDSAGAGAYEGGAEWLNDQAEMFEMKTWVDLGNRIEEAAGTAYDFTATYVGQRFDHLKKDLNKHIEHPEDILYNWAWWQVRFAQQVATGAKRRIKSNLELEGRIIRYSVDTVLNTADTARKIFKHRAAILNLPELIAKGDPRPIQAFIDNELTDIDRELARAIRYHEELALVLEIIADHDTALTYLSYVGLMLEAIPPNFYAYVAGKGAAYLMIEVVLLVVSAILSAGSAAALRIVALLARFAKLSATVASAEKKLNRAKEAVQAFLRIIDDFSIAAKDLQNLGRKLVQARSKPYVGKAKTKSTLKAKKESIKREKRCRACGSTKHSTPRARLGTVVYK